MSQTLRPDIAQGLCTTRQASAYLSLAVITLNKKRWQGGGPLYIKVGGKVLYRQEDLEAYAASFPTRHSTSEKVGVASEPTTRPTPTEAIERLTVQVAELQKAIESLMAARPKKSDEIVKSYQRKSYAASSGRVVYALSDGNGGVKIGRTNNIKHRFAKMRTANRDIVLIDCWPGGEVEEQRMHSMLENDRISGEWFRDNETVRRAIVDASASAKMLGLKGVPAPWTEDAA